MLRCTDVEDEGTVKVSTRMGALLTPKLSYMSCTPEKSARATAKVGALLHRWRRSSCVKSKSSKGQLIFDAFWG